MCVFVVVVMGSLIWTNLVTGRTLGGKAVLQKDLAADPWSAVPIATSIYPAAACAAME